MILVHLTLFLGAATVVWFLSGMLIDATVRVARRFNRPGFGVAFFLLGILTSIGELSVSLNSTIEGVPQVAAGNLVGGALVIFLLIVPILALAGNGIEFFRAINRRNVLLSLAVVALPVLLTLDGSMTRTKGLLMLMLYITLFYSIRKQRAIMEIVEDVEERLIPSRRTTQVDMVKIAFAALLIFLAGNVLVDESVYFSELLGVPTSIIGMLVLSIGTNIPEMVIAFQAARRGHDEIALGDYMGSSAANTAIFAIVALVSGTFAVEPSEFRLTAVIFVPGLVLFYIFSRTKDTLSRREGGMLLALYIAFLLLQFGNIIRLAL